MEPSEENDLSHLLLEYLPDAVVFEICKHVSWQDILHIGQTCRRFYQLCHMATVWLQLRTLDFSSCTIPIDNKILDIIKKCPHIEYICLASVITSEHEADFIEKESTSDDRFLLQVLRLCSNLNVMSLSMGELTDISVNAICSKCENLQSLTLSDNDFISNEGIVNLLSYLPYLTKFHIIRCTNVIPMIKHKDEGQTLALKDIRIESCELFKANILTLLRSCVQLEHLCLLDNRVLQGFPTNIQPTERSGMDTLKTLKLYNQSDMRELNLGEINQLEMLKIQQCPHLLQVNMLAPKLKQFQIESCGDLKSVNLCDVKLTDISLSGCENLRLIGVDSTLLKSIDLSTCRSLTADKLLIGIPHKSCVEQLNITDCDKINSSDINNILSEFTCLTSFVFGGESLTSAEINSVDLTTLCFKKTKVISCLPMNIASLKTLKFEKCLGLSERHLLDGMLFGEKRTHGIEGLESLIQDLGDYIPFKGRVGVPSIQTLILDHIPGVQGLLISDSLRYFKQLTDIQFINCAYLKELHIHNLSQLSILTIESCNHLSSVKVENVSSLRTMVLKWCSMINTFRVTDVNLLNVDVTGCNFAHFFLRSASLPNLSLSGVCTQPTHTLTLKCPNLTDLSIQKCNSLDDIKLHTLFSDNPRITSLTLSVSDLIRYISIPSGVTSFGITALKRLQAVTMEKPIKIHHLKLNNLIKFTPSSRLDILRSCSNTLTKLEVRAIPKEQELSLYLPQLESLTLDQGIDLLQLEIFCPKLVYLRIQGCPRLNHMLLQINKLSQLQVHHSSPLLALRTMVLHVVHVQHVAHVLAHYSPNLSTLELNGSQITKEYLCELGSSMHKLSIVNLNHCVLDLDLEDSGNSFVIGKTDVGIDMSVTVNINNEMDVG